MLLVQGGLNAGAAGCPVRRPAQSSRHITAPRTDLSPPNRLARMGAEASETGRWIQINGARLYCDDRGAGPPIVLIHAGLISRAIWEPLLPALIDDFRVITPDSRGHGRSTNPSGELSYGQIAADVAALITALELDRPVVGGYSDGGQVALEIGARHPEAAGGFIIGAAYPDFVTTGLRGLASVSRRRRRRHARRCRGRGAPWRAC